MVYIFYSDHSKCQYVPIRPQDNTTAQTLLLPSAAATHHRPFRAWRLAPSWRRKPKHSSTPHADWLFRARCSFLAADWLNVVGGIHAEYHCNSRRWAVHQRILTTTDPAKSVSAKEKISWYLPLWYWSPVELEYDVFYIWKNLYVGDISVLLLACPLASCIDLPLLLLWLSYSCFSINNLWRNHFISWAFPILCMSTLVLFRDMLTVEGYVG